MPLSVSSSLLVFFSCGTAFLTPFRLARSLAVAEETVDRAVKEYNLKPKRGCITKDVQLVGSQGWSPLMFIKLIQQFGLEVRLRAPFFLRRVRRG